MLAMVILKKNGEGHDAKGSTDTTMKSTVVNNKMIVFAFETHSKRERES